jgi:hypothetical protein
MTQIGVTSNITAELEEAMTQAITPGLDGRSLYKPQRFFNRFTV